MTQSEPPVNDEVLREAIQSTDLKTIKAAFLHGIDVNTKVYVSGLRALHYAAQNDSSEAVEYLLKQGADVNARTSDEETPLHLAYRRGSLRIISKLIDSGAKINAKSDGMITPLHLSAVRGDLQCLKFLLDKRANPNALSRGGHGLLYLSCKSGSVDLVRFVHEEFRFDLNRPSSRGYLPLHAAASSGNVELVKYIVSQGAKDSMENMSRCSALHMACGREAPENNLETVKFLVEDLGYDIHSCEKEDGWAPIHFAARFGKPGLLRYLISKGARVDQEASLSETPLHMACSHGTEEVIAILLENGANINACTRTGMTPLMWACYYRRKPEVVRHLLACGADPHIKTKHGETALDQCSNDEARRLVLEKVSAS